MRLTPRSAIAVLTCLLLAACGRDASAPRDPATEAARSALAQSALFCPNEGFSWAAFEAMADQLGAAPDGGEVKRPPTIRREDIVRERWVALNQLGYRTTVWIAELGPGTLNLGETPGFTTAVVPYSDGLVCAVHDPTLSREEAFAPTREWSGGRVTGGVMQTPGDPASFIALVRTWVNSPPGANFYQDFEIRLDMPEHHDGALFIRHRYAFAPAGETR
jgi:hypothetical protein